MNIDQLLESYETFGQLKDADLDNAQEKHQSFVQQLIDYRDMIFKQIFSSIDTIQAAPAADRTMVLDIIKQQISTRKQEFQAFADEMLSKTEKPDQQENQQENINLELSQQQPNEASQSASEPAPKPKSRKANEPQEPKTKTRTRVRKQNDPEPSEHSHNENNIEPEINEESESEHIEKKKAPKTIVQKSIQYQPTIFDKFTDDLRAVLIEMKAIGAKTPGTPQKYCVLVNKMSTEQQNQLWNAIAIRSGKSDKTIRFYFKQNYQHVMYSDALSAEDIKALQKLQFNPIEPVPVMARRVKDTMFADRDIFLYEISQQLQNIKAKQNQK
ncbi:Hypothetical_protein [Hexamita inflata]|uniref:Hypothetical_protein n=1 Tax=Hexamita inflata TaxID=28002 RepID=A0AA86QT63_9EUKA|nr:Hypothetical protein HINF_LOCUS47962 [Hexamita inflata]